VWRRQHRLRRGKQSFSDIGESGEVLLPSRNDGRLFLGWLVGWFVRPISSVSGLPLGELALFDVLAAIFFSDPYLI
jgi:hypothetical protein